MPKLTRIFGLVLASCVLASSAAKAGFIGTELSGTLTGSTYVPVTAQFSPSTLIVGSGQEFVGTLFDESFKGTYQFNVGFTSDTITLDITGTPNANIGNQDHVTLAGFVLSGFSPLITDIMQAGGPSPAVNDISYVNSVFTVGFNALSVGKVYSFDVVSSSPVPEPATLAVLAVASIGLVALRRKSA